MNRRGQATFVMCRDCGDGRVVPRCDSPLTYHEPIGAGEDFAGADLPPAIIVKHSRRSARNAAARASAILDRAHRRSKVELVTMFPGASTLRWES